jgi:hypothetical protein
VLAPAVAFFCFDEAESTGNTGSETSPISSVSGRLPEASTASSNCTMKTANSQKLDLQLMNMTTKGILS